MQGGPLPGGVAGGAAHAGYGQFSQLFHRERAVIKPRVVRGCRAAGQPGKNSRNFSYLYAGTPGQDSPGAGFPFSGGCGCGTCNRKCHAVHDVHVRRVAFAVSQS